MARPSSSQKMMRAPGLLAQLEPELGRDVLGLAHAHLLARLAQLSLQLPNPLAVIGHGQAVAGFSRRLISVLI
jgi:hypothetical protein